MALHPELIDRILPLDYFQLVFLKMILYSIPHYNYLWYFYVYVIRRKYASC